MYVRVCMCGDINKELYRILDSNLTLDILLATHRIIDEQKKKLSHIENVIKILYFLKLIHYNFFF